MPARRAKKSKIDFTYSTPQQPLGRRCVIRTVERLGGQPRLKRLYHRYLNAPDPEKDFFQSAIDLMRLNVRHDPARLQAVPRDQPVLFIANHPYGVLDGLVLTWLARQARPDIKVLTNHVLCQAPDARPYLLPVDFSGRPEAIHTNLESRRLALAGLRDGGAIGIFPAGSVAASEKPLRGPAVDTAWHPFTAKLVLLSKATVVPIYFAGQNSRMFQLASHTSYTLRLSLFFWETARRIGKELEVAIGAPIPHAELAGFACRGELIRELRRRTYALAATLGRPPAKLPPFDREFSFPRHIRFDSPDDFAARSRA